MVGTITFCRKRAAALVIALGSVLSVAACAAPPITATTKPSGQGAPTLARPRILAVRPVSEAGSGNVAGVLTVIGAASLAHPLPGQFRQEVIMQNAHGRVLSVVRAIGPIIKAGPTKAGTEASNR